MSGGQISGAKSSGRRRKSARTGLSGARRGRCLRDKGYVDGGGTFVNQIFIDGERLKDAKIGSARPGSALKPLTDQK
ncbi:hypothetical protein ACFL3S_03675 [Gemmatimonadota bacterium]